MNETRYPSLPSPRDIRRVFIANRGEIAIRIIRACQKMGLESVVGVSECDINSKAAKLADRHVVLGPSPAASSYLNIDSIVNAAKRANCDAIHPGYGFLSERAAFASACKDHGLIFIGPTAEVIALLGDKISAIEAAEKAGVPCVPGSNSLLNAEEGLKIASDIGFPVLIKASAGGGGRGMRIVEDKDKFFEEYAAARAEAEAAFGDSTVFLEKFIRSARHIEVQLIADDYGNTVHLGERECSVQRRHQKLIEEAPSTSISDHTRSALHKHAVQLAHSVGYISAGTVEFIVDKATEEFYFLEMNTRIQVEHPVTEMVTGIDIVAEQLRIACGLQLSFLQHDIKISGHSIECRINAENAENDFRPTPGTIHEWQVPTGPGIRFDSHGERGAIVPHWYDSMIGKLITHGNDRNHAIERMQEALEKLFIEGIHTTIPWHSDVMKDFDFRRGDVNTRWVETTFNTRRKDKSVDTGRNHSA